MSKTSNMAGPGRLRARLMATAAGLGLVVALGGVLVVPAEAVAQATAAARTYAIPAGDLGRALTLLADQADLTLLYPSTLVSGRTTAGVSGSYTPGQALGALLAGSGLVHRFTGTGSVTIEDPSAMAALPDDGAIILDQVDVTAWVDGAATGQGFQGTPDWVYETPSSISVVGRDAITSANVRDARDLLSNVSGAYVNGSNATYPSISPNLRGLQDMGRVVVSIDGARQNGSQTIAAGAEGYQGGSSHAYVDSAFIRSVEVEKTATGGSGSGGSLGGSVTFRTVGADDLIEPGNDVGGEINVTTGTNSHTFDGSILAAARLPDTPFALTLGLSGLKLGEYQLGENGTVRWNGVDGDETNLMGRDNWSGLAKLEGDFGDLQTALTWTHQEKKFSYAVGGPNALQSMKATTDTLTASAEYDPADNDLIDLNARVWLNSTLTNQLRHQRTTTGGGGAIVVLAPDTYVDNQLTSVGVSLDNTSRFETPMGALSVNYGIEAFRDDSNTTANSSSIALDPTLASNYTAFYPSGLRDTASLYASATLEPVEWLSVTGGLRYDWYRLQGSPTIYHKESAFKRDAGRVWTEYDHRVAIGTLDPATANPALVNVLKTRWGESYNGVFYRENIEIPALSRPAGIPGNTLDLEMSEGRWLPSITAEFKPTEWFRPYVSYSQSMRPPTIAETFMAGGLPSDLGPGTAYAPYDGLKPETARTWEIGANLSWDGLMFDQDSLRVKIAAFDRVVDNYIVVGEHYRSDTADPYGPQLNLQQGYMNVLDPTKMRGLEFEGNYDTGIFWVGGSASYLETEWGQSVAVTSRNGNPTTGTVALRSGYVPPKFKLVVDGGVRLMEERLTLGATVTHVTPTLTFEQTFSEDGAYLSEEYTKLDLYSSLEMSENATLRLSVDNVFDINYVPAGSRYPAPGRTVLGSLNVTF